MNKKTIITAMLAPVAESKGQVFDSCCNGIKGTGF